MATYQDNPPQYFPLTIPNNSVPDVAGYYVTVTDTGTTNIFRKSKSGGVFVDTKIGEIPKKGTFVPASGGASTEETQYFSGTLNATNLITNQAVPVVNRGIGGVAGGGNSKINDILGTNLADPPPASDPLAPSSDDDPVVTAFTGLDFNPTTYENTEKAETKLNGGILVYPRDHGDSGFDFISIQPIEYIAQLGSNTLRSPTESGFTSLETASQRLRKEVKTGPAIYLPMTPGISETNSVGWGEDRLNAVQLALGNKAMDIISNPQSLSLDTALGNLSGITNTLTHLADSPGLKNYISAYFAGQAVSANLLGRSGMVINPNLELLFQGPKLRSFRYSFKFTPRDADEAEIIRAIIKTLKKTMAVRRNSTSIFLGVPSVYKIKYIYNGGGDHPFLNKIKPCALTSFNVNYTPDGSYMTYGSNDPNNPNAKGAGSMTSYTVDMQFDELEPIYNDDIDDVDGPTTGY